MRFIVGLPHSGEVTVRKEFAEANVQVAFGKKPSLLAECADYYNGYGDVDRLIGKLLRSRSSTTVEIAPHFMLITKVLREVFPNCLITALRKAPELYSSRRLFPGVYTQLNLANVEEFAKAEAALYDYMLSQTPDVEIRRMF